MTSSPPEPGGNRVAFFCNNLRHNSRKGSRGRAGLGGNRTRNGAQHHGAGLGLPPCIDDGTAVLADLLAIPHPRFGIDGFAHRSQQAQAVQLVRVRELIAPFDKGADGRGRGVEDGDFVFVDDLPEAILRGKIRRTLIHQRGDAVLQDAVDNVGMAGDPSNIRSAPVDVVVLEIEDQLAGEIGLHRIAAGGVHQPFGLAGGAGGVEDVQRILCIHGLRRTLRRRGRHQLMPPLIASFLHVHRAAGTLVDHHMLDGGRVGDGLVHNLLELDLSAAAIRRVLRKHGYALRIVDAVDERVCGEASEDDGVHRANAGAGEQSNRQLRRHAHVHGDAVALPDAERPSGRWRTSAPQRASSPKVSLRISPGSPSQMMAILSLRAPRAWRSTQL